MALQKQNFDVLFNKGADNGHDPKLVIPSKFTRMENLEWTDGNTVRECPGFTSMDLSGDLAVTNIRRLHALGEEVLIEADSGLHTYLRSSAANRNPMTNAGVTKAFERMRLTQYDVSHSQTGQYNFDADMETTSNQYECWAWTDYAAGSALGVVYYKIVDRRDRSVAQHGIVGNAVFTDSAYAPRVIVRKHAGVSTFHILYVLLPNLGSARLKVRSVTVSAAGVLGALSAEADVLGANIDNIVGGLARFDACYDSGLDKVAIAVGSGAGEIKLATVAGSNCTSGLVTSTSSSGTAPQELSVTTITRGGTTYVLGAFRHNASISVYSMTSAGASALLTAIATVPMTTTDGYIGRIAILPDPATVSSALIFYDYYPYAALVSPFATTIQEPFSFDVGVVSCEYNGANPGTASVFARGVKLYARPVSYVSSIGAYDVLVPVELSTTTAAQRIQATILMLKYGRGATTDGTAVYTPPLVLARVLSGQAGSSSTASGERLPNPFGGSLASPRIPIARVGRAINLAGTFSYINQLCLAVLDNQTALPSVEHQKSLFMTGACPQLYDGQQTHEAAFNYYPQGLVAARDAVTAGSLTLLGTYQFVAFYRWQDATGRTFRSAVSVPVSKTLVGAERAIQLAIPFLRLTDKQAFLSAVGDISTAVKIDVYRTAANGTVLYYEASYTNLFDSTTMCIHTSILADTSLIAGEILYTTGGGLDDEDYVPTGIVCTHQRRLFFVDDEDRTIIQYTNEDDDEFLAVGTNEVYRLRVLTSAGEIVALASMDDKLIAICEKQICFFYGSGPNRLGQQNTYSEPQICSSQLGGLEGCQEAVCLTPEGLWFMGSTNGLRMLTRGLQLAVEQNQDGSSAYLGRAADSFFVADYSSVQARTVSTANQVRWFLGATQIAVIWDYQQQQWSTFTARNSNGGSVSARGLFWHSDGTSLFSSDTTPGTFNGFLSDGTLSADVTVHTVETAWMSLAGLQGFERCYRIMLLMQSRSVSNTLFIEVGYDYEDTYATPVSFTINAVSNPLQVSSQLIRQKCNSVRFRISWQLTTAATSLANNTEALRLTGMSLSVGVKQGLNRLSGSKRF